MRKKLPKDQERARLYVEVTEEVEKDVRRVAVEDGGTVSWVVDRLLREALKAHRQKNEEE